MNLKMCYLLLCFLAGLSFTLLHSGLLLYIWSVGMAMRAAEMSLGGNNQIYVHLKN